MNASLSFALASDGDGIGNRRAARVLVAANGAAPRLAAFLGTRGYTYVLADSAEAALGQLKSGGFDLVVSALNDAGGCELLRHVRQTMPGLPVIMLAPGGSELDAVQLDCATGLRREMSGGDEQARLAGLTARERQVLSLIVAGRANKVIAYELSISPRTVENHRARVMEKLRVKSVAELVRLALNAEGFVPGLATANDTGHRAHAQVPVTA